MPKNNWMVVTSPENFKIAQDRGFDIFGLKSQHRRKVQRIQPEDRILLYIWGLRRFGATATVTAPFVEDHTPIWHQEGSNNLPFRIGIRPDVVLNEEQFIDANQIAPRMDFVRRWTPELWYLAFQGNLHLISKYDFSLIEEEMRRIKRGKRPPARAQRSQRPIPLSNCKLDSMASEDGKGVASLSTPSPRG